jgi:hypothetical protein
VVTDGALVCVPLADGPDGSVFSRSTSGETRGWGANATDALAAVLGEEDEGRRLGVARALPRVTRRGVGSSASRVPGRLAL